jgi:hypothetical protein
VANLVLIKQAVAHSEYSADHIRHLLSAGLIKGEKVGLVWLIDLDSLKQYEQAMKDAGLSKYRPKSLDHPDA